MHAKMSSPKPSSNPWSNLPRTTRQARFEDTMPGPWQASANSTFGEPSRRLAAAAPPRRSAGTVWLIGGLLLLLLAMLGFTLAWRA
jgi:hypothetical protein